MAHICKICNKIYSSYQSLWIHNKKFHNQTSDKVLICSDNGYKYYNCRLCNKNFTNVKTRWSHEKNVK